MPCCKTLEDGARVGSGHVVGRDCGPSVCSIVGSPLFSGTCVLGCNQSSVGCTDGTTFCPVGISTMGAVLGTPVGASPVVCSGVGPGSSS